jgi:RNA polymerase-associated protein RTF1
MTEFNREQILEERSEQKQRLQTARALDDMVKLQLRGGVAPGDDSVSRAAKRMLLFLCHSLVSLLMDV